MHRHATLCNAVAVPHGADPTITVIRNTRKPVIGDRIIDDQHQPGRLVRGGASVALRRHVPANLPAFQRWYATPEIARLLRHDLAPMGERASRSYFNTLILPMSAQGTCWAIHLVANDRLIGTTALTEISRHRGSGLFRIVIGEADAWGHGYGTEATRLVCEEAFTRLELRQVNLEVFAHNPRAIATYQRVGFVETGSHVEVVREQGVELHVQEMALDKTRYDDRGGFASRRPIYPPSTS